MIVGRTQTVRSISTLWLHRFARLSFERRSFAQRIQATSALSTRRVQSLPTCRFLHLQAYRRTCRFTNTPLRFIHGSRIGFRFCACCLFSGLRCGNSLPKNTSSVATNDFSSASQQAITSAFNFERLHMKLFVLPQK